jgi:predicted metalloprotease
MRLEDEETSSNVEDRRGGRPMRTAGGLGLVGVLLILGISWLTGTDPRQLLQLLQQTQVNESQEPVQAPRAPAADDRLGGFASRVLRSTEKVWEQVFSEMGARYTAPHLVLFNDEVASACGYTSSAVGPFYCSEDQKVYLDLSFFAELSQRFGAPGDFAHAYVIAHEVGHHVQNLLGIQGKVAQAQERARSQADSNAFSVRLELQADCLAGVWANRANRLNPGKPILEPGDAEEGLRAAAAIGDDRMQRMSTGRVQPESFTHGSSKQRVQWLNQGLQTGDVKGCQAFQ